MLTTEIVKSVVRRENSEALEEWDDSAEFDDECGRGVRDTGLMPSLLPAMCRGQPWARGR